MTYRIALALAFAALTLTDVRAARAEIRWETNLGRATRCARETNRADAGRVLGDVVRGLRGDGRQRLLRRPRGQRHAESDSGPRRHRS